MNANTKTKGSKHGAVESRIVMKKGVFAAKNLMQALNTCKNGNMCSDELAKGE